ncbi:MAG TPA: transcriptional regulator, partial [Halomonas sp.]|nr:transcriptional regulator [Halomonas sp.]
MPLSPSHYQTELVRHLVAIETPEA